MLQPGKANFYRAKYGLPLLIKLEGHSWVKWNHLLKIKNKHQSQGILLIEVYQEDFAFRDRSSLLLTAPSFLASPATLSPLPLTTTHYR